MAETLKNLATMINFKRHLYFTKTYTRDLFHNGTGPACHSILADVLGDPGKHSTSRQGTLVKVLGVLSEVPLSEILSPSLLRLVGPYGFDSSQVSPRVSLAALASVVLHYPHYCWFTRPPLWPLWTATMRDRSSLPPSSRFFFFFFFSAAFFFFFFLRHENTNGPVRAGRMTNDGIPHRLDIICAGRTWSRIALTSS